MAASKKGGLGRGLDALFADAVPVSNPANDENNQVNTIKNEKQSEDSVQYINIHDISQRNNQQHENQFECKTEAF